MSKVDRALHGPGWGEVILGAILSLLLGIALGAAWLVMKPVVIAKEMPKEPVPGTVYYVEGLRGDMAAAQQALSKRNAFIEGQSITLVEQEVNAVAQALVPSAPAAQPEEKGGTPQAKGEETIAAGTPNVRIRDGVVQVGVPVTFNLLGIRRNLIAQARGGFERQGDIFAYEPSEIYLGSCPVQRLPFLAGYIERKLSQAVRVPEDIAASWRKLSDVSAEGRELKLTM